MRKTPVARKEPVPEEKTGTSWANGEETTSGHELGDERGDLWPRKPLSPLGSAPLLHPTMEMQRTSPKQS